MSEKLDGVRCVWNGKTMRSRNGNFFKPPAFFTEKFPDMILDGELFLDRGEFSKTISIVKKKKAHDGWSAIKYLIFDAPDTEGNFETRLSKMKKVFADNDSPYVALHEHTICKGA